MKYTVCYAKYLSQEIEANSPREAVDQLVIDDENLDDWQVTLIVDECGREVRY